MIARAIRKVENLLQVDTKMECRMLRLAGQTRDTWIVEALENLSEVLLDHAHCEKKRLQQRCHLSFGIPNTPILSTSI